MRIILASIVFCAPFCAHSEEVQPSPSAGADYISGLLNHYETSYAPPNADERCESTLLYVEAMLASELVDFDFELDLTITGRGDDLAGVACTLTSRRVSEIQTSIEGE